MGYMDLMRAKRKSAKAPSLRPKRWNKDERHRIEQGICVKCGDIPLRENSFLCPACESMETLEDIHREIAAARRKAKNGGSMIENTHL